MIIDCKGLQCPEPVLRTRDALSGINSGVLEVVVDNEASKSNVERFSRSQGCDVSIAEEGSHYRLEITKEAGAQQSPYARSAEEYACDIPQGGGLMYVISSNTMGMGDDELGWGLLQTYIQTIKEVFPQPSKIFFYNSGVLLTSRQSGILRYIKELEERGVEIFSCGTCIDFFNNNDKVLVGKLTNMYDIMDSMVRADKVVSPF
ncbi:MAG: sulfurtransferase-like selenium metabolism protein YedF [Desulfobulbaceae bacterium]|uniref:Sulfurtransferase-like selenium metabolism protein YedF n=1 Tax=Candidatus Desulfobia pelagia TaxID=2841692 RepID=A0A8J6TCJ6_9BACT|nr:sulfurtransferase-like selenium metabolism protein YedF [Candidatus Desulfobia pelagia]